MSTATNGYEIRRASNGAARLVVEQRSGRLLAGVGHDQQRAWVFPVHTPRGISVTQESAFDHPFHRSIFVGHGKVRADHRQAHFWAFQPDWRSPHNYIYQKIGILRHEEPAVEPLADGFRFIYETTWRDEEFNPMFDETRVIDVHAADDATLVDVSTTKNAAYADVEFLATKHGVIGVRVQPQLLPVAGGTLIAVNNGELRSGAEDVINDKPCECVAYEADIPTLGRAGVILKGLANTAGNTLDGPWFCRDYGMAMFNPTHINPVSLRKGETWTVALRTAAYDGAFDHSRAEKWFAVAVHP